jgi:hypothetical protein
MEIFHFVASNFASVVLNYNFCGASVGIWRFTIIARPYPLLIPRMAQMPKPTVKYTEIGMTWASSRKNGKGIWAKVVAANIM